MAHLADVFAESFRSLGYLPTLRTELEGTTGRRYATPLLLEKDARRLAVTFWLHRQPLGPNFLREFLDSVRDAGLDGGLVASLGAVPEALVKEAASFRVQLWDSRRVAQELGHAVLAETCPDVWEKADPLVAPRASRIVDQIQNAVPAAPPPASAPPTTEPAFELPFPAEIPTLAATPATSPADVLQVPAAFGIFDQAPVSTPTPPPAPMTPAMQAPPPPLAPSRNLLRLQVSKDLAHSLAKVKARNADRTFLRLVPHHVFDYEAHVLVEGRVDAEARKGRMAVDAAQKRAHAWTAPLETMERLPEGAEVDEKPIRVTSDDAARLVTKELKALVTRDVVMEDDSAEWKVVVKKKVTLGDDEIRLNYLGVYWQPVWRIAGREGSVEIDGGTGQTVFEESLLPKSDAQLI